jgi:plastocyanin
MLRITIAASALLVTPLLARPVADDPGARMPVVTQMIEDSDAARWGYAPPSTSVMAGQSLTWTNIGEQPHTATDDGGAWDTGIVAAGASASFVFTMPGTYAYHCTLHPWMKGAVVVVDAAPQSDDQAPTTPDGEGS